MEIVIAAGGMPFGPDTLKYKSLGGSETAVIMMANELKALDHLVTVFCELPAEGEPDYIDNGADSSEGVRYVHINNYSAYISNTQCDLLIASRDPRIVAVNAQARKKVLWCHDIATHRGLKSALEQCAWTVDEIWAVSDWYRHQINEVTDYPLNRIKVVPNGIVPCQTLPAPRSETQLVYAARPERGLENLIRPGGIMERLPEFNLKVAMYAHFPPEMQSFYEWCHLRIQELPNVEIVGSLRQQEMRQLLADSAAYIYPTQFEETSCILARECISVETPFLTTMEGALEETLGNCGTFFEKWCNMTEAKFDEVGDDDWCQYFADFVRYCLTDKIGKFSVSSAVQSMPLRDDLYWDTGARIAVANAKPDLSQVFSRAWSLVQDGDVIPAYALLTEQSHLNLPSKELANQIEAFYPFILPEDDNDYENLASYYKRFYAMKEPEICYGIDYARGTQRFEAIKKTIAETTKPGDFIVEYGCGEGHVSGPLAHDFPDRTFVAFDHVGQNVDMVNRFREDFGTTNLTAHQIETPLNALSILENEYAPEADAVICVEVLEHCVRPWEVAQGVEAMCKLGGQVIITTPYGAWEPMTFAVVKDEFQWRNHIWHLDKNAARTMFGKKPAMQMMSLSNGMGGDGRMIGNLFYTYEADHEEIPPLNPLKKAREAHSRQTVGAAIICMNDEDTILHTLHSLDNQVHFVQFAMGPSTDRTRQLIDQFFQDHPHMQYRILNVPKIQIATKTDDKWNEDGFGFDDARNASTQDLAEWFDWIMWIDTDEYLSGNIGRYLRPNNLSGYIIPQHHFTVAPRGAAIQIDRPARLFRTGAGYKAVGHIHEHFEVPKGGPGECFMLTDVDLGHTGYVNEDIRKDRFHRNFPFLVWDHETNDRKLGKFLWFRDIIHRMRWAHADNQMEAALKLANEGNEYYNENWKDMATFGSGTFQAIEYLSEIRKLLGTGMEVELGLSLDDRNCVLKGRFLDTDELMRVVKQILDPEFEQRRSKYF